MKHFLLTILCLFIVKFSFASSPGISFDDINVEDYSASESESSRPDDVDNEVIQSLVDKFLNKGTLIDDEKKNGEKVNKEAQMLINSSEYWNTQNLQPDGSISDLATIQAWLNGYSTQLQRVLHQVAIAGWNYFTSASINTKIYLDESEEVARQFLKATALQSRQFTASAIPVASPERIQLAILAQQGMNALNDADIGSYNQLLLAINQIFTDTQICTSSSANPDSSSHISKKPPPGPTLGFITPSKACQMKFTDLPAMLQQPSTSAMDCLELWQNWRQMAGMNLTKNYLELVELTNKGARLNGFQDAGAMWRSVFELPTQTGWTNSNVSGQFVIQNQVEAVYQQILPFYQQIHAYFRPRLAAVYMQKNDKMSSSIMMSSMGDDDSMKSSMVSRDGPIPIHLLKSLNGDNWGALYEQTRPFADEALSGVGVGPGGPMEMSTKLADEMLESFRMQNYTVRTMFSKVYRYMKFLGFEQLPRSVWTNSIFSRNWSKDMICHPATAYDMVDGQDYRIKICGQLSEQDFVNAHKLMAKLYYAYASRHQPILLKDAPNPSLSSALAGAFSVLALNSEYLQAQKLIHSETQRSESAEINRLYREALDDFVSLPFAIVADKWRYSVFENRINSGNWSEEWWMLREKYQGIRAPLGAEAAAAMDSVASPSVAQQHSPAVRNFVAYVAQFQILERMCGDVTQLSQGCVPSKTAMAPIIQAIAKGGGISWLDAFEQLTGTRQLDARPLLKYFAPLINWLQTINDQEKRVIGWENAKGEGFPDSEIPQLKIGDYQMDGGGAFGPTDDTQIAYPGQSCTGGKECLLDTVCNGSICVCRKGLFTLRISDTYNCVTGDPREVGFVGEDGGLNIALNPNNETSSNNGRMSDDEDQMTSDNLEEHTKGPVGNSASNARTTWTFVGQIFIPILLVILLISKK